MSNRIAALEDELGFPLFNRSETVSLTEEGRAFLKEVAPLLDRLDDAVEHCRSIHRRQSRTLGIETVPGNETVLRIAHEFKRENPDADVEIADLNGSSIVERIQSGKAMCGLFLPTVDIEEAKEANSHVAFSQMAETEMFVWVDADSALGSVDAVEPRDLEVLCLVYPQICTPP